MPRHPTVGRGVIANKEVPYSRQPGHNHRRRGASKHLFLQYAFDVAALLVTELPLSRTDVVVYLIR